MGEKQHNLDNMSIQDSQKKPSLDEIDEKDLRVMELKLQGINYRKISNEVDMPYNQVAELFRQRGRLYDIYMKYKEERLGELRQEALDLGKAHVKTAFECLIGVMAQKEQQGPRVSAADKILDRVLGKVPNVNMNYNQDEYDEAAEIFKDVINNMKPKKTDE